MLADDIGWKDTQYSFTCMSFSDMMADLKSPNGSCSLTATGMQGAQAGADLMSVGHRHTLRMAQQACMRWTEQVRGAKHILHPQPAAEAVHADYAVCCSCKRSADQWACQRAVASHPSWTDASLFCICRRRSVSRQPCLQPQVQLANLQKWPPRDDSRSAADRQHLGILRGVPLVCVAGPWRYCRGCWPAGGIHRVDYTQPVWRDQER